MGTAVLGSNVFSLENVKQLRPENVRNLNRNITRARQAELKRREFISASEEIEWLTYAVENKWSEFPKESKEELEELAYSLSKKPSFKKFSGFIASIKAALAFYRAYRQGVGNEFLSVFLSMDLLVDAILSAIEGEALLEAWVDFDEIEASSSDIVFLD